MHDRLPASAARLLPHEPPMVYIDRLLEADDERGLCETILTAGHMLLDDHGTMERSAFIELAAQSFAALKGWEFIRRDLPFPIGYLVGAQGFECLDDARQNDRLLIETVALGTFEGFGVVRATITRDGDVLARGKIKLYVPQAGDME